ncbi:MAG: ABC transporter permease [Longispora sp.]|nr:ABC transporter permease [Longispora sp. (in: high G+C Gram-positive bacteria)]
MSVLDRPQVVSTRFLRSELMLIFGRRRNWAGGLILAVVPIIIAVATKLSAPGGNDGPPFAAAITGNGLFVALAALTLELPLFLPLAVSAIAGDSIAGEANSGTLRYLLTVPVSRARLLAVKYAGIVIFAVAAAMLVAGVGVLLGITLFGAGDMTLLSGTQIGFGPALLRTLFATLYIAAGIAALGAVGLFISTLTEQPIGATIALVIFTLLSFILGSIPQISWLHPYLINHWWMAFGDFFRAPIAWEGIQNGLFTAAAYALVFYAAAWARFAGKDITS